MTEVKREYGVVGLGRMGGNLALQTMEKGIKVAGFDRMKARPELLQARLVEIQSYDGFRTKLSSPRAIFVYIPAAPEVAGLPQFGYHTIRHFVASFLVDKKKVFLPVISRLLRHKNLQTTETVPTSH